LIGKPTPGAVLNTWIEEVVFDIDTADGRLNRYQEIKKYHLMKSPITAADLFNELARQSARTDIGRTWWRDITHRLRMSEEMQIEMKHRWSLTHEVIQSAVESIYNSELAEEQSAKANKASKTGVLLL
jgi:hypothetical protein